MDKNELYRKGNELLVSIEYLKKVKPKFAIQRILIANEIYKLYIKLNKINLSLLKWAEKQERNGKDCYCELFEESFMENLK